MTTDEQLTATATLSSLAPIGGEGRGEGAGLPKRVVLRRVPSRSLVLAQSWIPFSVSQRGQAGARQSTLRAAEAFTLLSSELATRRGEVKPPTA